MTNRLFVVVGATGNVGRRVAERLAGMGYKVRGIARDTAGVGIPGVEMMKADLRNFAATTRALRGATDVYLTPPEEGRDPLLNERTVVENVIHVSKQKGVRHLMMHTAIHADSGATGAKMIDTKTQIERVLAGSGVPYTILRPGWFLQNLLAERHQIESGILELPLPASKPFPTVSADDVAVAAVEFLERGPQNRGFDVHLEKVAPKDIAAAVGRALGNPLQYRESPVEVAVSKLIEEEGQRPLMEEFFQTLRKQDLRGHPEDLTKAIPGFRYTDPEAFARLEFAPDVRPPPTHESLLGAQMPAVRPSDDYPPGPEPSPDPLPAPGPEPPPDSPGKP